MQLPGGAKTTNERKQQQLFLRMEDPQAVLEEGEYMPAEPFSESPELLRKEEPLYRYWLRLCETSIVRKRPGDTFSLGAAL
jgi:hypothetical protein